MIRKLVFRPVRYMLDQVGLELRPKRPPEPPAPTLELTTPRDAVYHHGDVAFAVPLTHCMYPYLFSYGPGGWHPFVEVLKEYRAKPGLAYENSVLRSYYERFHPKTVLDVFFHPDEQTPQHRSTRFARLAIPPHDPIFPWDPDVSHTEGEAGLDASHGNQGFGPVTDAKGELEFRRLTETLESIATRGYQPGEGHDGDIRGYLLIGERDYRFVVRQGLHRTAVLAALGYDEIRVRFFRPYPRAIFLHDLPNWPQVKSGHVDPATAAAIFGKFFTEDGTGRARRLDLLPAALPR